MIDDSNNDLRLHHPIARSPDAYEADHHPPHKGMNKPIEKVMKGDVTKMTSAEQHILEENHSSSKLPDMACNANKDTVHSSFHMKPHLVDISHLAADVH